jgi:hypothetical protein
MILYLHAPRDAAAARAHDRLVLGAVGGHGIVVELGPQDAVDAAAARARLVLVDCGAGPVAPPLARQIRQCLAVAAQRMVVMVAAGATQPIAVDPLTTDPDGTPLPRAIPLVRYSVEPRRLEDSRRALQAAVVMTLPAGP